MAALVNRVLKPLVAILAVLSRLSDARNGMVAARSPRSSNFTQELKTNINGDKFVHMSF